MSGVELFSWAALPGFADLSTYLSHLLMIDELTCHLQAVVGPKLFPEAALEVERRLALPGVESGDRLDVLRQLLSEAERGYWPIPAEWAFIDAAPGAVADWLGWGAVSVVLPAGFPFPMTPEAASALLRRSEDRRR